MLKHIVYWIDALTLREHWRYRTRFPGGTEYVSSWMTLFFVGDRASDAQREYGWAVVEYKRNPLPKDKPIEVIWL